MVTLTPRISVLFLLFFATIIFNRSMCSNHSVVRCNKKDRETLLIFKHGINDSLNRLSSWSIEEDCCAWKGVWCDNITNRVTKLDLKHPLSINGLFQPESLKGEISLSLLELEFLRYLDLSDNSFKVVSLPPNNFTYVSNLQYLDLSHNFGLHMNNLHWLSQLSSLKYLDLSGIDLHKETNWLQSVAMLPSLSEFYLTSCNLSNIYPSLKFVNFSSLITLHLSFNNFNSELPYWLFNISSEISYLSLWSSNIHGEIPSSLLNLQNLRYLVLRCNQLEGSIPDWIGQHKHLQSLDLSKNMFSGTIPSALGNLSSLVALSIASNSFSGAISETLFSKLSNLKDLDLSNSNFAFNFDSEWIPPFKLDSLALANTNQGPNFPSWIYTHTSLQSLVISSSGISSVNGEMFKSLIARNFWLLDISNNSICEDLSNVKLNSLALKLDRNNFTGRLPYLSPNVSHVDLSHNSFSGPILYNLENFEDLNYINLWSNKFSGEVPMDLSNLILLQVMNIGKNEFSGTIPNELPQNLEVMILRSNQFEGDIPLQIFNLSSLFYLDLAHNKFSGSLPRGVYNTTEMGTDQYPPQGILTKDEIDLFTKGQYYDYNLNMLRQTIDISANNLSGEIPLELFTMTKVQTLNLSYNHFTGTLQKDIGDMKNLESLDLSNNKLSGEIPQSMATLFFLSYLTLSCNNFIGKIPEGTQLQSFDAPSYTGNPELCGPPLTKCIIEENPKNERKQATNGDDDSERESLYLGLGVGFAVGFWGVCGPLFLNKNWRHTYYRFIDRVARQLYVALVIKFNNFCKTQPPAS